MAVALSSTSPLRERWTLAVTDCTFGLPRVHSERSSIWKPRSSTTPPPDSRFCRRHSGESHSVRCLSQPALAKKISPRSPLWTKVRRSCASGLLCVTIAQRHELEPLGPLERRDVADLGHRSDAEEADPEVLTRHELAPSPYRGCTLGRALGAVKRDGRALRRGEAVAPQLLKQALAREAQRPGGARLVAARPLESLAQAPLLERAGLGVEPARHRVSRQPRALR